MALSGSSLQKASWNSKFGLKFYWSGIQNIAGNYTDIIVDVYGWLDIYAYLDIGSRTGLINIAGNNGNVWMPAVSKYDSTVREIKLASRKVRVKHKDDGTLPNVAISSVWPIQATIDGVYRNNISAGFNTGSINRIPRASSISSNPSFTIGNSFPITIKRASDSFKHDVYLKINDSNFKTVQKIDTNHTFTFNDTDIDNLYELTKNSKSIDLSLVCDTFSDTTKIGSTTKNGYVYVDEASNKPIFNGFTFEAGDIGTKELTGWTEAILEDNGLSIKTKTKYKINCQVATPKNHATIVRYELELNKKITSSETTTIESINTIDYDDYLIVNAIDSRGFKTNVSRKITTQDYQNLKMDSVDIKRLDYPDNTRVAINFSGTISKRETLNNVSKAFYRLKETNIEEFGNWIQIDIVTLEDGKISINDIKIDGFSLEKSYNFELKVADYYRENIIKTIITNDTPIMTLKEDGIYSFGKKIGVPESNIIYEKVLEQDRWNLIITDLDLKPNDIYDIRIEGSTSAPTDIAMKINNINTAYWQMGKYYTDTATADKSGFNYITGIRTQKDRWYFAHSMRPELSIIEGQLTLSYKPNTEKYYPFYKWRATTIWSGYQLDADCYGACGNAVDNINRIDLYCSDINARIKKGTKILITRRK